MYEPRENFAQLDPVRNAVAVSYNFDVLHLQIRLIDVATLRRKAVAEGER